MFLLSLKFHIMIVYYLCSHYLNFLDLSLLAGYVCESKFWRRMEGMEGKGYKEIQGKVTRRNKLHISKPTSSTILSLKNSNFPPSVYVYQLANFD